MKKKLILIVLSSTVIVAILIFYAIDNSKRLYDESKPNIFEIPGTASRYVGNYNTYYDFYFMIQKTKSTEIGIRNMIENFVMENYDLVTNVLDVDITENPSVYFHFMKPSRQFPVYFEENKSYFKGYFILGLCGFAGVEMTGQGFYMSVLKNGVLLRNRKAENRPLMKVMCSLLLLAPCLSALMS